MRAAVSSPDCGFSLVEVLVASTILATGIASLAHLFLLAAVTTTAAGQQTRGAVLAAQKVEELRSAPWGLASAGQDQVGAFTRSWFVDPFAQDPAGTVVIQVVVDRRGGSMSGRVVLITLQTRTGP